MPIMICSVMASLEVKYMSSIKGWIRPSSFYDKYILQAIDVYYAWNDIQESIKIDAKR